MCERIFTYSQMLWSKEFAEAVFSGRNSDDKTPLQLAVEKGHVKWELIKSYLHNYVSFCHSFSTYTISILETLKACVDGEREAIPPLWHRKLKTDWWKKVVPYFLYAASCGSLVAVKCFIASGHEPNIRYMYYQVHCLHTHVLRSQLQISYLYADYWNCTPSKYPCKLKPFRLKEDWEEYTSQLEWSLSG